MAQRVLYSLFPNSQHPGSQWHSDYYTDFSWQSFLTIPMAQRLLHRLLLAISFDNPNGTATVTQTSFGNFFWQSQWHSDCYTDFFWQFLLTIPMAQRLLHRLLLAISFDNPNGTATVTQTSFVSSIFPETRAVKALDSNNSKAVFEDVCVCAKWWQCFLFGGMSLLNVTHRFFL